MYLVYKYLNKQYVILFLIKCSKFLKITFKTNNN